MSLIDRITDAPRTARRRWRSRRGLLVPTGEAVAEALATIPPEVPWPWACFRVVPTIRGKRVPYILDDELEEMGFQPASAFPTLDMSPGVAVTFAIEVDPVYVSITQEQLDRWEMTLEQVRRAAELNIRRTIRAWNGGVYRDDYAEVPIRMLKGWPHWAASLALLPDELQRIFGSHDQLFVAPYHCNLVSMPVDVDRDIAADLIDLFGYLNPQSLLLGLPAFALRDGELSIEELPGLEVEPDDEAGAQGPMDAH
jgi:hypothetical protein